jgi:hypothetical protein
VGADLTHIAAEEWNQASARFLNKSFLTWIAPSNEGSLLRSRPRADRSKILLNQDILVSGTAQPRRVRSQSAGTARMTDLSRSTWTRQQEIHGGC